MPDDAADTRDLVFGHHPGEGLVAVECGQDPAGGGDRATLFVRDGGAVRVEHEPFRPFLWARAPDLLDGAPVPLERETLAGRSAFRVLARFASWKDLDRAVAWLRKTTGENPSSPEASYFFLNDPVEQHLCATGRTCFKGRVFSDLRRLQFDLETDTTPGYDFPNAEREGDRIVAIGLADSTGWTEVLRGDRMDEKAMIERFVAIVRERDPDAIEGHNVLGFDLPYLAERARRHRVRLALGRDGSAPRVRPGRFSAGERAIGYPKFEIHGRSVVDTFFLVQIYDVSHRSLPGYGLKEVARHFGVPAPGRTYIDGAEIAREFRSNPGRVMDYVRDDVVETRALGDLLAPVYFAQAQILPFAYQNVCVRGSGAKIDALLLRASLRAGRAIPAPDAPHPFQGGYTDIFFTGLARRVHHCDVRSLYPSIMLREKLGPRSDETGVFLALLAYLRDFRVRAKEAMRAARSPEERIYQDALQTSFKILINSFYGYLGFEMARFSDFAVAERVAARGREILRAMIDWIRAHGGQPIEIDTDGIYFVPPEGLEGERLERWRSALAGALPAGIDVEFDGEYEAMLSYKMKNYALLDRDGEVIIKGAALKSRGLEPFQRDFLREAVECRLRGQPERVAEIVERYRAAIRDRQWPIQRLAKTERLQEAPAAYAEKIKGSSRARNAAYELALASKRDYRAGDTISYYVTGDKKSVSVYAAARPASEWDPERRDENVPYYLAKLEALAKKFETGFGDDEGDQPTLGL